MRQIWALTTMSLRDIPHRLGNSLVIVVGIAGVVAVLIPVLAMYQGFRATIASDGRPDRAIVLSREATEEYDSSLSRETVATIVNSPGVRHDARGSAIASAEIVLTAPVSRLSDHSDVSVTLRGVGPQYFALRPELKLIAGRMFQPGTQELLVGQSARTQFAGLQIGNAVRLQDGDWVVVGVFAGGKGARESELVADAQTVMSVYKRDAFNSVAVALESSNRLASLREAIGRDSRLVVTATSEPQYLASQSSGITRMLRLVTYAIGSIMALGAVFAALNSMYSSVVKRATETATVRAIGFSGSAMAIAVLAEAFLLALLGAAIGAALAYGVFNGVTISTLGGAVFDAQVVYSLAMPARLILGAVALACTLGLAGGLVPAIHAARANIPRLLQET
ncbi:MAG: ABC transporter permease [Steroidobacteraceae bacterium]